MKRLKKKMREYAQSGRSEPETVMTYPPGAPPATGTRQLTLGEGTINWNQFGGNPAKGIEYNWRDQPRRPKLERDFPLED